MGNKILDKAILKEMKVKPLILGSDINAYSLARIFHEYYDIIPDLYAMEALPQTANSNILRLKTIDNFNKQDVFVENIINYAKDNEGSIIIVIPCSDFYSKALSLNKDKLKKYVRFNVPSAELNAKLENKLDFYETADKYGIPYPKTTFVNSLSDFNTKKVTYPIVLKPQDSISFYESKIKDKRKVYILDNEQEVLEALENIYNSEYTDKMIIQDFIPGDATNSMSLNAYCDVNGKVRMMALGQILLDDPLPLMIGNNNAIYTVSDQTLFDKYEKFLNDISYTGFANIDLKFDKRDGQYKAFEMNLRLPATNFFMVTGGLIHIDFLLRDLLEIDYDQDVYYHHDTNKLWLNASPILLKRYTNKKYHDKIDELLKNGYEYSIWYKNDRNFKRFMLYMKRRLGTIKHFYKFGKKPDHTIDE